MNAPVPVAAPHAPAHPAGWMQRIGGQHAVVLGGFSLAATLLFPIFAK